MTPKIRSRQRCTVEPLGPGEAETLQVGDIVLCKVKGLHLVKAIQGPRFLIGNNRGGTNGWIGANAIFGRLIRVE